MSKKLFLEGFIIRPVAHVLDLDADIPTLEMRPLGEQKFTLAEMHTFITDQWPQIWAGVESAFAQEQTFLAKQAEQAANSELAAKRAERKTKATAAKKTTAKRVPAAKKAAKRAAVRSV